MYSSVKCTVVVNTLYKRVFDFIYSNSSLKREKRRQNQYLLDKKNHTYDVEVFLKNVTIILYILLTFWPI